MLTIPIHLDPKPQIKTKFTRKGWAYTPKEAINYIERLQWQIRPYAPSAVYMGPVEVDLTFFLPIPKATSKVSRRMMNNGTIFHIIRPDLDNLAYTVTNAMKGIIYDDDSQIVSCRYRKFYGDQPRIVIKIKDFIDEIFTPDC